MNELQGSSHSVLLPAGRIALFAKDETLRNAAESLKQDWRFARVSIEVIDADVETAIELYAHESSPDIVMVETADIGEGFIAKLENLSGNCSERTAAVVIGPVNDVYLYRKLIDMGVSDYLVKPMGASVMADVFSKILIEKLGTIGSRLIACIGAKGGVGTSTLSVLMAQVSGTSLGQKTILLDAAGGWSYLSVAMGGESVTTLHEVARASKSTDRDSFNRMIVSVGDKLSFLGTGAEALLDDGVSAENYEDILNRLMQTYPVVIVDLSSAPIDIRRMLLARAHEVVVVSTPTLPSLRTARGLLQEIRTLRGGAEKNVHIALSMKGSGSGAEVSESDMSSALKVKPAVVIEYLPKLIAAAEGQGKQIPQMSGGESVLATIQKFMSDSLGFVVDKAGQSTPVQTDKGGLLGDLLGKIKIKG